MKKIIIIISLLIGVSTMVGCSDNDVEVTAQTVEQEAKIVKTQKVEKRDFEVKTSLPGVIKPVEEVMVTAKVNGSIEKINVGIGDRVQKDDVLLQIDDGTYELQYKKALSGLKNSQNTVDRLSTFDEQSGLMPQSIEGAYSQFEASKINFENTKDLYERISNQYQNLMVSKESYEQIENQYKLSKVDYERTQRNLEQAKRNSEFDIEAAGIAVEMAQNDVAMLKLNLENTRLKSPISGIISASNLSVGENISPGMAAFSVINIDKIYFESGVSEQELNNIKVGNEVNIMIESLAMFELKGTIEKISPTFDEKSKTYPFKVIIENKDNLVKAGMFATSEFIIEKKNQSLAIPKKSVFIENDKSYVYIVENGFAVRTEIETGYEELDYIEVISGLDDQSVIIIEGIDKISNNDKVKTY